MFRFDQQQRRIRLATFGLGLSLLGCLPGFAAEPTTLTGIETNPAVNQVIIHLSSPNQGTLVSPIDKGQRRLLVDIQGASLNTAMDKAALLAQIKSQLPDVAQVTLDEFRGAEPMVRLMIKTKDPAVTGALVKSEGDTLVLQLLQPMSAENGPQASSWASSVDVPEPSPAPETAPIVNKNLPSPDSLNRLPAEPPSVLSKQPEKPTGEASKTVLNAKTSHSVSNFRHQRKVDEAASRKREAMVLAGQVERLQKLVNTQSEMIIHLKEEQTKLLRHDSNEVEKKHILSLQRQVKEMEQAYEQMQKVLEGYRKEITQLEANLKLAEDKANRATADMQEQGKIKFPDPAQTRGGLLNTLASLTKPEVNQLIEAEETFRAAKKAEFQGDVAEAQAKYKAALQLAPQVKDYAMALATLYIRQKQLGEARDVLEAALQYHTDDMDLLNEMGKIAILQKDESRALGYFKKALPVAVLSNYASTLRRANQMDQAEIIYKLAISANPHDSDLQFNLGNLYLNQKRYTDAQVQFMEALKLKPQFAEAHFHLGLAQAEQGNYPFAVASFKEYLKLMPEAPNRDSVEGYIKDLEKTSAKPAPPRVSHP